jgi:hypothetical protein
MMRLHNTDKICPFVPETPCECLGTQSADIVVSMYKEEQKRKNVKTTLPLIV